MIKEIIKDLKTHFVLLGAIILFFIFLLLRLFDLNFFANVRQSSFDYYQNFFPISYEESPVVIVAIDEKSLENALIVIDDYARGALLLESEINRERGIILAEKHTIVGGKT